jgi:hypothetical protein
MAVFWGGRSATTPVCKNIKQGFGIYGFRKEEKQVCFTNVEENLSSQSVV